MATHEEWLEAREQRDRLALRAVTHLLAGDAESATTCARLWDIADDKQAEIARALDSETGADA